MGKQLDLAISNTEKQFGKGSIMRLGDHDHVPVESISTGCLSFDMALGIGGFPRGRVCEIYGPESCLDKDTFVGYEIRKGKHRINHKGGTIARLYERFHNLSSVMNRGNYHKHKREECTFYAPCVNEEGRIFQNIITDVVATGKQECFEISAEGYSIRATENHKFFSNGKFISVRELKTGDKVSIHNNTPFTTPAQSKTSGRIYLNVKNHGVAGVHIVDNKYRYHRLLRSRAIIEAEMNNLPFQEYVARLNSGNVAGLIYLDRESHVHHIDENTTNDSRENLLVIDAASHGFLHSLERHNNLRFQIIDKTIDSIKSVGIKDTYDIRMMAPFNNFVANNFVVHNSGKTTAVLHLIANAQKAGGIGAIIDAEHALDPIYAKNLGVDTDNLLVSQPDFGEQALEIADALVKSGEVDILAVDSVAALIPKNELDGNYGDAQMGLQARMMSQAMRKLTSAVHKSNCCLVFINQLRSKIGVMFGNPETTTGGAALKFYSSVRCDIRRLAQIKDGDNVVGSHTKVKIVKNKLSAPFKEAEFDIMYGKGISRIGDLLELGTINEIVQKNGSWFSYQGERIGQGKQNVVEYLESNPEIADKIEEEVRGKLGLKK